jgi:hypothetical protein
MNPRAQRRPIELYFLLYLMAVLLLLDPLPPAPSPQPPNAAVRPVVFRLLFPRDSVLRCVVLDSAGIRRVEYHDPALFVRWAPALEEPQLELDWALPPELRFQPPRLRMGEPSPQEPIAYELLPEGLRLQWLPVTQWSASTSLHAGRYTYPLRLLLRGRLPDSHTPVQEEFRLSFVVDIRRSIGGSPPSAPPPPDTTVREPQNLPPLVLWADRTLLQLVPGSSAEVRISAEGMDLSTDLAAPPQLETSNVEAQIRSLQGNLLTLGIRALRPGTGTVRVTVERRRDARRATAELRVEVRPWQPLQLPDTVYVELPYELDPKLPELSGQDLRAEFWVDTMLLYRSFGEPFTLVASSGLAGRVLRVRRFINGELWDEARSAIAPLPPPELAAQPIQVDRHTWRIRARCYSTPSGNAARLELVQGDASIKELYGERQPDGRWRWQTFELKLPAPEHAQQVVLRLCNSRGGQRCSAPFRLGR